MTPFTGDYIKHLEDSKWKTNYYTFTPCPLTSGDFYKMDEELTATLSSAHRMLGLLEGMVAYMPDKESIKALLLLQESYYCRSIDYIAPPFRYILAGKSSAKADVDIVNAILLAYEHSFGKVFTTSTLSEICSIALYGGEMKNEIEIRKKQKFLHNIATNLKIYNPTAPEHILPALADLSAFLMHNEITDILIKAALIHYQFETIHPYECYNGILGRIIVPMILWNTDYKAAPYLGLSKFLFCNKNEYLDKLSSTQWSGGYIHWIKFFVKGICEAAADSISTIKQLHQIFEQDKTKIESSSTTTKNTWFVYEHFKSNPISEIKVASERLEISFNTVSKSVNHLMKMGILQLESEQSRHRQFLYTKVMSVLNEATSF